MKKIKFTIAIPTFNRLSKIKKAIDLDDLERKNMASKAIERTSLNFNNDAMCFKTLEIYSDLINRNSKNEK